MKAKKKMSQTLPVKGPALLGIDINHNDNVQNMAALSTSGNVGFFIFKTSEGMGFKDPAFSARWELAGERGYTRGAYHFFSPGAPAKEQVKIMLDIVKSSGPSQKSDFYALDWEKEGATPEHQAVAALNFLQELEQQTQKKAFCYCNLDFAQNYASILSDKFENYMLWLAYYSPHLPDLSKTPWKTKGWTMWQYAADKTGWMLPGCTNTLDVNVFRGTHADFVKLLSGA